LFDLPPDRFRRRLCVDLMFCIALVSGRRVPVLFAVERSNGPLRIGSVISNLPAGRPLRSRYTRAARIAIATHST
jgi:hypothetical protein